MFWSEFYVQDLCCKSTQLDKDIGGNYENQSHEIHETFSSVKYVLMKYVVSWKKSLLGYIYKSTRSITIHAYKTKPDC